MAATLQSLGFAVSGALLMQLLPGLVMQSQVTGAAWGWSSGPECKPAAGSNWAVGVLNEAGSLKQLGVQLDSSLWERWLYCVQRCQCQPASQFQRRVLPELQ
ncbi:unnamed protein product [Polarella glacialis]|uniref:Uncharacterized protein n=1 Tax=Polarella glacialis TaxID=89957 RepID=A0A813DPA1_POLGL|nr:unnamed protein product [Polarella glacialis]